MNTASVTISTSSLAAFAGDKETYFGSTTSTSINNYVGSVDVILPNSMQNQDPTKTYAVISQIDTGSTTRAKFTFSYSIMTNNSGDEFARIRFRDVTETVANGTSVSISFIIVQDKT